MAHSEPLADGQVMRFEYQVEGDRWSWSGGLHELHGVSSDQEPTTQLILRRMIESDRPVMLSRFRDHLQHEGSYSCVYRMTDPQGQIRRLMFVGHSEAVAGTVERLSGIVVDLTEPMREHAREAVAASAKHRAAIEQAKGVLMVSFGMDADAAFSLLRTYSNHGNVKLAILAERIVAGIADPASDHDDTTLRLMELLGVSRGLSKRRTA
jgi:hypothetical protein